MQDWKLGLAAVALYPLQIYLIPKLQRQVNLLGKERVRQVRRNAEKISEVAAWVRATFAPMMPRSTSGRVSVSSSARCSGSASTSIRRSS